jgi:CBS domain-containing protein
MPTHSGPGQGRAASDPYPGPVDEVARTAADVMLTTPARHPPSATVDEIRDFFRDDHVHAALIVSPAGYLQAVVEREDIAGCPAPDAAVAPLGRLAGRSVPAGASLAEVHRAMIATGRRRAAVISADGRLLGLLCLKASRPGFCSEQDVRARTRGEADRAVVGSPARDRSGQLSADLRRGDRCARHVRRAAADRALDHAHVPGRRRGQPRRRGRDGLSLP